MVIVYLLLGLGLLVAGAELLVRGASSLARAVGLSPLVIGLTVVAYGTSAPEFAVSMKAGLIGQADIAVGNVVGSNMFNVLLILGISALITPLAVSKQLVRLDVPVMICVSVLAWLLSADGTVGRIEGAFLFTGIVLYSAFLVYHGRRQHAMEHPKPTGSPQPRRGRIVPSTVQILAGLVLLVAGARWLVEGATGLARLLGISELVIGLTVVAAGTSLPELATSVVAAVRRERDIAIGNIVGSNIFNILAVLGAAATVSGRVDISPAALRFDIPVMTAVAVACLPIFFTGGRISRWEGALFIGYYFVYVAYLVLKPMQYEALPFLSAAVVWFALPGTLLGIGLSVIHALRTGRTSHDPDRR